MSVDELGDIVSAQDYYAYGQISKNVDNSDPNGKYKFTERDRETNYDYFGARYYDSD